MKGPVVGLRRRRQREGFRLGGVGPIIQAKPQAVYGEIGIDALRSRRKCHAVDAEAGE